MQSGEETQTSIEATTVAVVEEVVYAYDWPDKWDWLTQIFYWTVCAVFLAVGYWQLYHDKIPGRPTRPMPTLDYIEKHDPSVRE